VRASNEAGTSEWSDVSTFNINGVSTESRDELPAEFGLSQNYPNPFNPTTKISYTLPRDADVSLVVFDVLGREVLKLMSGVQPAGRYEVTFDARDLPSGLYLYRLEAGGFVETKSMVLLK
jgi:hypothetical protein